MAELRLISADSHMMEPADFWETRLDAKYRDRAPRVVQRSNGQGLVFTAPGISPFPVAGGFGRAAAARNCESTEKGLRGGAAQRMGSRRAHQRPGDRWRRGRSAIHHSRDAAVRDSTTQTCSACFHVYNNGWRSSVRIIHSASSVPR